MYFTDVQVYLICSSHICYCWNNAKNQLWFMYTHGKILQNSAGWADMILRDDKAIKGTSKRQKVSRKGPSRA